MKAAIAWMARNSVAANLLMVLILLIGFVNVFNVVQEFFPEASLDAIQVRVEYLGASPEEVEEGVVRRVEEQIESLAGIRRITSTAAENVGVVTAQLELGTDIAQALDDIKAEVDRITTFPVEAEEPQVQEVTNRRQALQLALHGPVPERALKELAAQVKDELTALPSISYVTINGVRDYEIAIEVSEATLRAYGLQLADVTRAVRRGSLDLPGGTLETDGEDILVRTKGQNYTGQDFRDLIVLARPDGTTIRLGDLATVRDGFQDADLITRFDGQPAALVEVFRTSDERVLEIEEDVIAYVDALRPTLPAGISVALWQNEARYLRSRYNLLIENGLIGLALVVLALALFLNGRLAFWVSMGIFISFLGVFAVMPLLGVSINMLSLLAFILALGIVVDDAIVIGENIFAEQENGRSPIDAAVAGATRLARPVTFAIFTTVAAFAPLLTVPGTIGKLMVAIPTIIIAVLLFSLVESLFILPAHLAHVKIDKQGRKNAFIRGLEYVQGKVQELLEWNINGPLDKGLRFATKHYGLVIVTATSLVLLSVGLVQAGLIKFAFLPIIEGENVIVRFELPQGTPAEETRRVAAYIEQKGRETAAELEATLPDDHPPLVEHVFTIVGTQPSLASGPPGGNLGPNLTEPHRAEVNFELPDAEERDLAASVFEDRWREKVGVLPGVRSIQFQSVLISLGRPIQLELSAPTPEMLDRAVAIVKDTLRSYQGVFDVQDDQDLGKREVKLALKPEARTLGLTLDDLARQVRAAFYGDEALRLQRGRDDIRVMVRLPQEERDALADLDALRIRTPAGAEVPFAEVADASFGFGPSAIQRRDRRRVVTLTADVNTEIVQAQDVVNDLQNNVLPALARDYPGLRGSFEGEQREQADTLAALLRGFAIALFAIYALLAIPFRSYSQPLVIMSAIPFGVIGAILGHLLVGINVTVLSMFGIVGLAGVVVNDSLVMLDFMNEKRAEGMPLRDAVIAGAKARFRPILLTSLTTFLGVLPLILERSTQAQFLIPIAVSLGFGILVATFILMLLVPALVMLQERTLVLLRRAFGNEDMHESATGDGLSPMGEPYLPAPKVG